MVQIVQNSINPTDLRQKTVQTNTLKNETHSAFQSLLLTAGAEGLGRAPRLCRKQLPVQPSVIRAIFFILLRYLLRANSLCLFLDEDVDVFPPMADDSPFSQSFSRRRPISRTYTRKKLISS